MAEITISTRPEMVVNSHTWNYGIVLWAPYEHWSAGGRPTPYMMWERYEILTRYWRY